MTTRRDFVRKAALGSATITSVGGLSVLSAKSNSNIPGTNKDTGFEKTVDIQQLPGWEILFDEQTTFLSLKNGPISVRGQLNLNSETDKWTIAVARDGIPDRYSIVDSKGTVKGYLVFLQNYGQLQLMFYYRYNGSGTFRGEFSFEGKINSYTDSFTCRTRPKASERILSLSYGPADSLNNDSLFSPENDSALRLDAASLQIVTEGAGLFSFVLKGRIGELYEAIFSMNLERDYFRNRYMPFYHVINRKRCPKTPTGWMSWNAYFDTATADDNLSEAKIGQKYLQPFGCEIWSIESWQGNSDILPVRNFYNMNLETSEKKFPKGMKQLADDIRELGFRPGIWMAPFGTGNTEFYNAHRDWFLHDKDGKPISCWNGQYTVDPTVPEAREHLKHIHYVASHEWGYEYFKIDGMSTQPLYERPEIRARFKDPSCPNPFELCIKAFREAIGEDRILLACGGKPSGAEAFYSDAYRIGGDIVTQFKPPKWSGIVKTGLITVNQIFVNNIAMMTDPDTLMVRDLPLEEARVFTTMVALPGQFTFFGDKLAGLPDERMRMLQQTLPVADVRPMSLYPNFSKLSVWSLRVHNTLLSDYNVIALFNWEDATETISFTTQELGVDSDAEYTMYEFWTQTSHCTMKRKFSMDVPSHSVRLLTMHIEKKFPQWISSDRHVAQNAMELKEYEWKTERHTLEGKIQLIGTFPLTMRLRVPPGFSFSSAECNGAKWSAKQEENNILAVTFKADKTGNYPFKIKF